MDAATTTLIISCLQAISFQATHFLYLRHARKRPYLSFRPSKVYGVTLNDTEVFITRVLCATPMCFTALQALGVFSKNDTVLIVLGHVFASFVLLGIIWLMKMLLLAVTDYLNELRGSVDQKKDLSRARTHSAINEKGVSDKIEAMMNTKNMIVGAMAVTTTQKILALKQKEMKI
ncbi:hypothetical protein TrLO_g15899 [Triparma laevis f. longispina]|uniref:Uncharacterized protein n=1 Tax=Triparma laevis f. longispina TaxID=1714387 RepID=A0A9W6ZYF4_9STRA|nr:hypothetical protein TrLO_g15899 [Triparma laevis f. longispina]